MIAEHHAQFTSEELPTLTELCTKHTLETNTTECPCCGETTNSSDHFYRHLAKHLEDVALLSLMPDSVQPTWPLYQDIRGRIGEHNSLEIPRRNRSAPSLERGWDGDFHDDTSLGGTSDEPFSSHRFRRRSWNSVPPIPQSLAIDSWNDVPLTIPSLAIDPDYAESRRSEDSLYADSTASSVISAGETRSFVATSVTELTDYRHNRDNREDHHDSEDSEDHEDQHQTPRNKPNTLNMKKNRLEAIFSPEPGYHDLRISNDDSGLVCYVNFESVVSAFRAAYKFNHRPISGLEATRLAIDFSGRSLSVRMADGPRRDAPLLEAVEQYPAPVEIIPLTNYDHEQTEQTLREIKTRIQGSGPLDFLYD